jgi:FixJ family two-component response regulator
VNGELLPLLAIIDDDESVRESLPDLLRQFGFSVAVFSSAQQFITSGCVERTGGLILDFAMPGMSGRELMAELRARGHAIPTFIITAQADEALRQRLLQEGAVECLFKPFSAAELLRALRLVFAVA